MNLLMFFDTETSSLPLWNKPSSDPGQPHIVQAAGILVDADTRDVISSFDLIARPTDWTIPDEVVEIHGITTERAAEVGVPEKDIVMLLLMFSTMAGMRIGHNQPFDARIVRIALKRFADDEIADRWKQQPAGCTQKQATALMDLPPTEKMKAAGRNHKKTANLAEAYQHFTGKVLEEAHSALADTLACMAVYWAIVDLGQPQSAPEPKKTAPKPHKAHPTSDSDDDGVGFL